MRHKRILLITNRESDNVGDQIIEASDISLVRAAMKNLGYSDDEYDISSRATGIISKAYVDTRDPKYVVNARTAISESDVIVFGGAPVFNYAYQDFYLRTILTLELAKEYGVPVIFSSIGVEPFDAESPKSVELKEALATSTVTQLTSRDDVESAQSYAEGTNIRVQHVADPAVFADSVFGPKQKPGAREGRKPKIGLVVARAGIARDNGIPFGHDDQRRFWVDVIDQLTEKGYDYQLFATGHFVDEVFLDAMVRAKKLPLSKTAIAVNSPEELIEELTNCDGVIAFRLHASITSYAYSIPSVGLSWNFKVPYFYDAIGYPDRAIPPEDWKAGTVIARLEEAMAAGVTKDAPFAMTVYDTLFGGLREVLAPDSTAEPFTYDELIAALPQYDGTGPAEYRAKVYRKLRRNYQLYQKYNRYYVKSEADKRKAAAAEKARSEHEAAGEVPAAETGRNASTGEPRETTPDPRSEARGAAPDRTTEQREAKPAQKKQAPVVRDMRADSHEPNRARSLTATVLRRIGRGR